MCQSYLTDRFTGLWFVETVSCCNMLLGESFCCVICIECDVDTQPSADCVGRVVL